MNILLACMYVNHMHTWSPEESSRSSGTGVRQLGATCRRWELNPLQKQQVSTLKLLTLFYTQTHTNIIYLTVKPCGSGWPRNQRSTCLYFESVGIKGLWHQAWPLTGYTCVSVINMYLNNLDLWFLSCNLKFVNTFKRLTEGSEQSSVEEHLPSLALNSSSTHKRSK